MASGKVSGSRLSKDRQAALLALADSVGDAKAAAKFGLRSRSTVWNYRQALATDEQLRQLYEAAKARQDAVDDRVVEAEAGAIVEVWGAVRHNARLLTTGDKVASPAHLEALAKIIEAAAKGSDQRAELELTRKMLEKAGAGGQRTPENPAHPTPGRGAEPPGAGAGAGPVH